LVPTKRR